MDRATITLTLNGSPVPVVLGDEAGYLVVSHEPATPLAADSTNRVVLG